jgi:hypothetical protein
MPDPTTAPAAASLKERRIRNSPRCDAGDGHFYYSGAIGRTGFARRREVPVL